MSEEAVKTVVQKQRKSKSPLPLPPQEYLQACFEYSPETGDVTWKWRPDAHFEGMKHSAARVANRFNSQFAGKPVGALMKAKKCWYRVVALSYDGKHGHYLLHRLIWRLVTGDDPKELEVDHKDTNGLNNRWFNLRLANDSQNAYNKSVVQRKGVIRELPKGVYIATWNKSKFIAHVTRNGKAVHLGTFNTVEAAEAAYRAAQSEVAGEFLNHQRFFNQ